MLNKLHLEEEPKEKAPLDVVIYKKGIEDSWKRPRIYEYDTDIPYRIPEEKKKKEPERGVIIIKMYSKV